MLAGTFSLRRRRLEVVLAVPADAAVPVEQELAAEIVDASDPVDD